MKKASAMDSSPNICFLWQGRWLKLFPNRVSKQYSQQNTLATLYSCIFIPTPLQNLQLLLLREVIRWQECKNPRRAWRWEAEGLWREKSAGLEEFEPKLTSQRKFPRESSLCCYLPTWNSSMFWQKKKKSLQLNSRTDTLTLNSRYRKITVIGGFKGESS